MKPNTRLLRFLGCMGIFLLGFSIIPPWTHASVRGEVRLKSGATFHGEIIAMNQGVLQMQTSSDRENPRPLDWQEVTGLATAGQITIIQDNGVILTGIASYGKQGVIQLMVESVNVTIPIGVEWVFAIRTAESARASSVVPEKHASALPSDSQKIGEEDAPQLTQEEIRALKRILDKTETPDFKTAVQLTEKEIRDLKRYLASLEEPSHRQINKLTSEEVADLKKKLAVNNVLLYTAENHLGQSYEFLPDQGWIPVTGIPGEVRISGFIQAALVHDFRDSGTEQQEFIPAAIPVKTVKKSQTSIDARSSRFFLEGRTHLPKGHFASSFFSLDMRGGGVDSGSEADPRLRQAFVTVDNFTFGQATTTFALASNWPAYTDGGQPNSYPLLRIGLFRYSFPLDAHDRKKSILTVALENSDTDVLNADNREKWPQMVLRYDLNQPWGTVMWAGLARNLVAEGTSGGKKDEAWVFGGTMQGRINIPLDGKRMDHLKFSVLFGNGLGNVIADLEIDGNNDGVYDDSTGKIKTTTQGGGWLAYEHMWSQQWRTTLLGSFVFQDNLSSQGPDRYAKGYYAMGNLIYSPIQRLYLALEYFYGKRVNNNDDYGQSHRVVFAARFYLGGI